MGGPGLGPPEEVSTLPFDWSEPAEDPREARRLTGEYGRAIASEGWGSARGAERWLGAPSGRPAVRDALVRDSRGAAVALVRWERTRERGLGRRLRAVALAADWNHGRGLGRIVDELEERDVSEGPLLGSSAILPGLTSRAQRATFAPRGYVSAVRTDFVYPTSVPVSVSSAGRRGPPGTARNLRTSDGPQLAGLMERAYAADVRERALFLDYRDPARDARCAIRDTIGGGLGDWLSSASFGREIDGTLIGATLANDFHGPLVSQVMTDPRFRRRGVASDLVLRTVAALRRRTRSPPRLVVTVENRRASRLYRSLGFVRRRDVTGTVWVHWRALALARGARRSRQP
jgi:ribosomal protein S18 acetylase RimI-like enzyme